MNVAVTGGTGCLGRPLIKKLLSKGYSVRVLVPKDEFQEDLPGAIDPVHGTISDRLAIEKLLDGAEIVFHLAGKVHEKAANNIVAAEFHRVNTEGTKLLLDVAGKKNVKRVVFYSTVGVYGKDGDFHGDEVSCCAPVTPYAVSKFEAEKLVLDAGKNGGPEGVVLRFPMAYGPFDRGNMAKLIRAVSKKRFLYFGDGCCLRSMISADNAAEAAILAAEKPEASNRVYCVTDGVDHTLRSIVDAVRENLGLSWVPPSIPIGIAASLGRLGDILCALTGQDLPISSAAVKKLSSPLTFSCDKIKRELGYRPVKRLREGISEEVEWVRRARLLNHAKRGKTC